MGKQYKKKKNNHEQILSSKEEIKPELIREEDDQINLEIKQKFLKKKTRKFLFGGILGFAIVFVIVSINLMGLFVKKQSEIEYPLVYEKEGELKFISSKKRDAKTAGNYSTSDKFGIIRYSNKTDKFMLYTINDDLYLAKTRSREAGKELASDVLQYYFSKEDNYILYMKRNGDLYSYDFKNHYKLDDGISMVVEVSRDKIFYKKDNNLYYKSINGKKEDKEKIAEDYFLAELNGSGTKLIYSIEVGKNKYDYYIYTLKSKKSKKVFSEIYNIYDYNDDFSEFIYSVYNNAEEMSLNNFIDDDKKESDENFKALPIDDYLTGKIDYDTFKSNQKEKEAVEKRNKIREGLKNETLINNYKDLISENIYYQKKNKNTLLAQDVKNVNYSDLGSKRIIFTKNEILNIEKIKLSEVESLSDVNDYLTRNLKSVVKFKALGGEEQEIASGNLLVKATILGDELYCEADGTVYFAKIHKNALTEVKTIGTNAQIISFGNQYKDGFLFIENIQNDKGNLNVIKNGKIKTIENDVYVKDLVVSWNNIYYYKNYNNYTGDLYSFNGKAKKIISDVSKIDFVKDNYMYIFKNYSSKNKTYDLYRYKNKRLDLIDKGIKIISFEVDDDEDMSLVS